MTVTHAFAIELAPNTAAWYRTHEQAGESILQARRQDHTYDNATDCRNTTNAAHAAVADRLASTGKMDREADWADYGHDGPLNAMTLSMCARNAAPQSWCTAVRAASANLQR